jgi:hypothetical protein
MSDKKLTINIHNNITICICQQYNIYLPTVNKLINTVYKI